MNINQVNDDYFIENNDDDDDFIKATDICNNDNK